MFTITEMLSLASRIEDNGRLFYLNAVETTTDPQIKALLAWMAEEEQNHGRWFDRWRRDIEASGTNPFVEEMTHDVLGDLLGRKAFCLDAVDPKALVSLDQVLDLALEFERDTVLFYEILTGFVRDEDVLAQLKAIIAEEQNHIRQLREKR